MPLHNHSLFFKKAGNEEIGAFVLTESIPCEKSATKARLNSVEAQDIDAAQHLHYQTVTGFGSEPENRWTSTPNAD
jgi:hypothetical protein